MNETIENLKTRRSIRKFKDEQITDEELKTILEAGTYAATGMGKQDYFRQSSLYQKILVKGNIRTFAAIRREVLELSEKIDKNPDLTSLDPADAERLKTILEILNYLF